MYFPGRKLVVNRVNIKNYKTNSVFDSTHIYPTFSYKLLSSAKYILGSPTNKHRFTYHNLKIRFVTYIVNKEQEV